MRFGPIHYLDSGGYTLLLITFLKDSTFMTNKGTMSIAPLVFRTAGYLARRRQNLIRSSWGLRCLVQALGFAQPFIPLMRIL